MDGSSETPVGDLQAAGGALMVDGPAFDLSEFDDNCRTSPTAMNAGQSDLAFDRGTSPRRAPSGFNTNWQLQIEGTQSMSCNPKDIFNGITQLMQHEQDGGQVGIFMNCSGRNNSSPIYVGGKMLQIQGVAASGSELQRLPEAMPPRRLFLGGTSQNAGNGKEQDNGEWGRYEDGTQMLSDKLDALIEIVMQRDEAALKRESAANQRLDNACGMMQTATARLNGLISSMMQREAELDARNYNRALDLRLACGSVPAEVKYNWMFGHGVTPRIHGKATPSQARFERLKVTLKKFALWFTDDATPAELSKVFIQFNDTPRVSISGTEIKEFILNHEDMSQQLESALIRVLRRDEGHREQNSQGTTHYVGKEWARKVVAGAPTSQCEDLFHKNPKVQYNLAGCKKVVVSMDMKEDGWASLSVDMREGISYLIHPNMSAACKVQVLEYHIDLMKTLTTAVKAHMIKLGNAILPLKDWEYEVALKSEHHFNGPESGFTTAFYSIPKDNQFMIVSPQTVGLAKHNFLYSMVRMSYRCTKRKLPQGTLKKKLRRGPGGKFIAHDPQEDSDSESDAASNA